MSIANLQWAMVKHCLNLEINMHVFVNSCILHPQIPTLLPSQDTCGPPIRNVVLWRLLRVLGSRITNLNLSISILLSPH